MAIHSTYQKKGIGAKILKEAKKKKSLRLN
jgi:hypothetical protein